MRWFTTSCLVLFITIASTSADWSWGDKEDASKDKAKDKANVDLQSDLLEGESIDKVETAQPKSWNTNETVLDEIVDELVNQKQGRSLGGFDDVYSDPQIKEALDSGKDASAKDLIKSRLCDLGLIQCEDEDVQEKRYFSPDELIYAQPVDIKPVGQPVASIPIRGPPRAYGPAKPMPQHYTRPQKTQPPKRIGYGSNPSYGRPGFSEKYGVAGNNNFQFSQSNSLYGGQDSNYVTRPPQYGHENPYTFEHAKPGYNKVPTTAKPQTVVQQHVHHHYVHEDNKDPKVIIKPVAIPVGSVGNLVSQGLPQQTPDIITGPGVDYSGFTSNGFKPMTASYNLDNSDTIYGSQKPNSNNYYSGQNGLGNFGSQSNDFYKKEFNVGSSANNLYNQGPAVFSQNQNNAYQQGFHEPKAQDFDCICVNFDQCPSEEIIGRRDDLYLPIDPRNKGSDIAALTDEQAENLNATETAEFQAIKTENATVTEAKKLSKREIKEEKSEDVAKEAEPRQFYGGRPQTQQCRQNQVCCRRPLAPQAGNKGQCGIRHSQGINGRIKTPSYVDGDSEFGEYPWQAAILKKDPKESIYACGGTLIDNFHIITAAHCIKSFKAFELRVRLGEWDVNHDVEFYPYIERDVVAVHIHPLYYAGTLDNDLAILKMDRAVEWNVYPHISPACLPDKYTDYAGQRCWTTGWGKDAFGDFGKYQNILKEVDVPILGHNQCQQQLRQTRLGYNYELTKGFLCAGGEEGKDACKGDGGGPLVCERGGTWQLVGVVSWGIGCGQAGVPGVYVKVAHYLDWISQITGKFSPY